MKVRVLPQFADRYVSKESGAKIAFFPEKAYKVHKIESYSESGNGFVVLVNEECEIWWVDNRHVRAVCQEEEAPPFPELAAAYVS